MHNGKHSFTAEFTFAVWRRHQNLDSENPNVIDCLHSRNRKLHQMPSTCDHLEGPISGAVEFRCLENTLSFHFTHPHPHPSTKAHNQVLKKVS